MCLKYYSSISLIKVVGILSKNFFFLVSSFLRQRFSNPLLYLLAGYVIFGRNYCVLKLLNISCRTLRWNYCHFHNKAQEQYVSCRPMVPSLLQLFASRHLLVALLHTRSECLKLFFQFFSLPVLPADDAW